MDAWTCHKRQGHGAWLALALVAGCQPEKAGPTTDSEPTGASEGQTTSGGACAEVIAGDLVIDDATDVAELACVVEVKGALEVHDTTVWSDMTALAALRVVGGDLEISRNAALASLDGLQALERVGGIVSVFRNPRLTGLEGLSGVRRLGGLGLARNALTSLAGLQGTVEFLPAEGGPGQFYVSQELLTELDGLAGTIEVSAPNGMRLGVAEMGLLVDVSGLDAFAAAAGPIHLDVRDLPALTSLRWPGALDELRLRNMPALQELALPGMTSAHEISLHRLPALGSLAGLSALRSVSGRLSLGLCGGGDGIGGIVDLHGLEGLEQVELVMIHGNASLTSLAGLPVALQAEHVFIRGNPVLPQAAAQAWLDAATQVGKSYSEACENLAGPACVLGCPPWGE